MNERDFALHQSHVHVRSELSCPACATTNSLDANFCKKCGARLREDAAVSPEPASLATPSIQSSTSETVTRLSARHWEIIDGERKTVTALFAYVNGSMELMEGLDQMVGA